MLEFKANVHSECSFLVFSFLFPFLFPFSGMERGVFDITGSE